jgi:hypothetical protein
VLGEKGAQRMRAVQGIGPVGAHHPQPFAPSGAREEGEEVERRAVRPITPRWPASTSRSTPST